MTSIHWKNGAFLFSFLIVACLVALNSCQTDHTLDPQKYGRIYIGEARNNPVEYTLTQGIDSGKVIEFRAIYGGPGEPKHDISVHFSIDQGLVDSFNIKKFTSYQILPEDNYELSSNTATIPAGQTYSEPIKLKIERDKSTPDNQYLLPITISESNGAFKINENLKTAYFVLHLNSLTPVNTPILITGFLVNSPGSDAPEKGDGRSYDDTKVSFTFEGGNEYMQFMALRDIDFSKTPYSVVVGRSYHDHKDGWASGEDMSFKFNLTEGQAKAGTFFYVGEGGKVINGYSHAGLSTDISDANWIRSISVNLGDDDLVAGDGFGNSTSGLLPNGSSAGIAVFEGTNITSSSVPLDAVFYGDDGVNGLLNGPYGYRIPIQSDLYSAVNEETGAQQPLFGQGSNTFIVEGAQSTGHFVQMGGEFNKGYIIEPRDPVILELEHGSQLSDIEGDNATEFVGQ